MTQPLINEPDAGASSRRGRGPARTFPILTFEEALSLPKNILEYGVNGEIGRLMLFDKLNRSPDSATTKYLVRTAAKYGLTQGTNSSSFLSVTEDGKLALGDSDLSRTKEKRFHLAIQQFEPYASLYSKLRNHRLPDETVLGGELGRLGVSDKDCNKAAEVFTANLRFLELARDYSGSEFVRDIEEILGEKPEGTDTGHDETYHTDAQSGLASDREAGIVGSSMPNGVISGPALHLDIQVHIDASASPEQIEQIFASMARHLYGRE